jgi:hypothetical protein
VPERGLSRFVPLFVILALILALAIVYGPGVIRAWKFRSTVNALLDEVVAGQIKNAPSYIVPDQRQLIALFVQNPFVTSNTQNIGKLKLTSYYREGDHVWAVVTVKQKDGGLGQGKLRWVWDGKQWQLDALNSYVNYGIGFGENEATRIGDLVKRYTHGIPAGDGDGLPEQ